MRLLRNLPPSYSRPSLVLTALAWLAGCTHTVQQPDLHGQDVHLTVIHTSDVHSRILPYNFAPNSFDQGYGVLPELAPFGGAARLSTLIRRERARASRSIHLDSGDCFEGAPIFNSFSGEVELRAMTALGVDAAALGNHEFDRGADNLAGQIRTWSGFPILAANYTFKDWTSTGANDLGQVVKPYTILNVDGLVVGVIGMGNISSLESLLEGGNTLGVTPLDTQQTVDYYAALLRPQVDLLVAVSHLGLDEDENTALTAGSQQDNDAAQVHGDVDVVFGGHLHIVLNPPKLIPITDANGKPTGRNTVLVHSGAFAKTFGRLDLVVHVNTEEELLAQVARGETPRRAYVAAYDFKVIPVTAREPVNGDSCVSPNQDASGQSCSYSGDGNQGSCRNSRRPCLVSGAGSGCPAGEGECLACQYCAIHEDGAVANLMERYQLRMNASLDLTRVFANAAVPTTIARSDPGGGDSQLGNLVATAMRLQPDVQADFSLTNSLGIRADFAAGPITVEQMYNVFPFENTIEIMYLSGREVQEMLDFVAKKSSARGCLTQSQVSGISFVMDCSRHQADLVLVGSGRTCQTDADCDGEACGTSIGFCQLPNASGGSMALCSVGSNDGCGAGESCVSSQLGSCGKLLNPNASYRVAVNDYIANGGSGFAVLKRNTAKVDTKISLRDALIDYMQRLDAPLFEGPYSCTEGVTPSETTCHGAIRCNDSRWSTDPYLSAHATVAPDIAARYCPGKSTVESCFGPIVCILPHNQQSDGRILPRRD